MTKFNPRSSVQEQAAYWFLRLRDDDVDPDEIEAALAWQDASPAHRDAFARAETFWNAAGRLKPTEAGAGDRHLSLWKRRHDWALAAAASLLLLLVGASVLMTRHPRPGPPEVAGADEVVLPPSAAISEAPARVATAAGENRTITLDDGSEVVLGGASVVEVNYSPSERRVVLVAGEALFHVAKNPDRPFLVDAGDGETQAIGTIFDVHRGVDAVTVTVVEGIVSVRPGLPEKTGQSLLAARLVAGHQVSYSPRGAIGPIQKATLERTTSWEAGELTFIDRPLADVVADLNRYSKRPIRIDDESLKALRITGRVTVGKMDDWLRALEMNLPIRIVAAPDSISLAQKIASPPSR